MDPDQLASSVKYKYPFKNILYNFVFHSLVNYYEFRCCIENIMDPDQLASSEASYSGSTLFTRVGNCFHTIFERLNCLSTERYKLKCSFGKVIFDKYIMAIYLSVDKSKSLLFPHPLGYISSILSID